ncbi:hypothetical protein OIDMADRAFT_19100 [Oidiodendron maius Zn]|uniref:Uncharacterized protein n=1 Tax=Oidiodendron maius (strain Zn) TaxID=913774 RepID=A0A0C3DGI5_OIDMZ|nr:hypothetical protein OIDMADRAFT_19100 [Oidiodendron maius Zn]
MLICLHVLWLLERQRSRHATWVLLREKNWPVEFRADRANISPSPGQYTPGLRHHPRVLLCNADRLATAQDGI